MLKTPEKHSQSISDLELIIQKEREHAQAILDEIPGIQNLIYQRILAGESSGDPAKDILYRLKWDPVTHHGLLTSLTVFQNQLIEHAGEFIVIESIDLIEVYHGGPGDHTSFPPREERRYAIGIIQPKDQCSFSVPENELYLHPLLHASPITVPIPIGLLAQLNTIGENASALFVFTDPVEPASVEAGHQKHMRFWIGNDAVACCMGYRLGCEPQQMRDVRKRILSIMEQMTSLLPNPERLFEELSDKYGFYRSSEDEPIAHAAT
jgi:hypothetical protein